MMKWLTLPWAPEDGWYWYSYRLKARRFKRLWSKPKVIHLKQGDHYNPENHKLAGPLPQPEELI